MDLVRAWGAGVVALLAAMWGLAFIVDPVHGPFWPIQLAFVVAGAAAALAHPWPRRRSVARHAAAVLTVPLLVIPLGYWLGSRFTSSTPTVADPACEAAIVTALAVAGAAAVAVARRLTKSGARS